MIRVLFCLALLITSYQFQLSAQESIDVTFRHYPNTNALRVFVPGEFNNWGNNSSGQISTTDGSLMIEDTENGFWYKKISLTIGGGTATYEGQSGYLYKFHEQYNASGTSWEWYKDPLNDIALGDNSDSYIRVTHPMIFQFQTSENGVSNEETQIWATVAAKNSDSIDVADSKYYLNGNLEEDFSANYDKDRQLFSITDLSVFDLITGKNKIRLEAVTKAGESVTDSLEFFYLPDIEPELEARPEGLEDGITYENNVRLSLFAPKKEYVFVIGDFNDWSLDEAYLMKKDSLNADSVWHWIEIEGLTDGTQYAFQYLVEGELAIADPYAPLLLHPSEDNGIPASVFPNLKEYPTGKTSGYVGLIEPGKQEYDWEATNYVRPDKESLVIYELLIRDFLEDHSFNSLIDSLDYLERLGVNAIELMPVSEFDGNESWGYNPGSHIALDKYYGTPEAFKKFVDEAHKRGIAVILDVVMNHATGRHSLYQLYDYGENPYFNTTPTHAFNVFNDFNHQYSGTQYYTKRMIEHWINEYKIDGFRWDLTKGFTQNCTESDGACTGRYQQDRVDLLKKYADYQWASDPDFIVIFEHLGTNQEESEWANYRIGEGKGVMLWGNMNGAYNEATMGYNEGNKSNFFGVLSESRSFQKRHLVGYMESHDEQWLMFKNRSFGNSSGAYDVKDLSTAVSRQKVAGAFFFTLPGPKMIWQFAEVGYGYGDNGEQCLKPGDGSDGVCPSFAPGRTDQKAIRWDYWNNPDTEERIKLYKTWSALINLRRSSGAFTNPDIFSHDLTGDTKWVKMVHSDSDVAIIGNFGVTTNSMEFTFPSTGNWFDFFTGESFDVGDGTITYDLGPGEFKVFTTKEFETPEEGITVENERENVSGAPSSFQLYQNYPNPFNPSTNITFDVAKSGPVTLEVYDIVGRKVAELVNEVKSVGNYTVTFDASFLSSGMYLVRFHAGQITQTQKMTLLK